MALASGGDFKVNLGSVGDAESASVLFAFDGPVPADFQRRVKLNGVAGLCAYEVAPKSWMPKFTITKTSCRVTFPVKAAKDGDNAIAVAGGAGAGRLLAVELALGAERFPKLAGDGVADDTAAIQARLDAGDACVYLPPPRKHYLISKTLLIGSGTELRLDRFSRVKLAPGSDCLMLANRDAEAGGNARIALTGGVWDFDNLRQGANPSWRHKCNPPQPRLVYSGWNPTNYLGAIMRFWNASNVCIRGVTFRNPVTYCCQFAGASDVTVDDITFDFDS